MALGSSFLRHPRLALSIALVIFAAALAPAQTPAPLADINTAEGTLGSSPRQFVRMGPHVYFLAEDSQHGLALHRTDGTAGGTSLVADLIPGPGPYDAFPYGSWLVATSSRVFFRAWTPTHGYELWASDGTAGGTRLVKDIVPGPGSSSPSSLAAAGERVFFAATDPEHGQELWRSDGTEAGTVLVEDLAPGPASAWPRSITGAGSRVFFVSYDGQGSALRVTDGTSTTLVKAVAGYLNLQSDQVVAMGGKLFFFLNGLELWVSDGTTETTFSLIRLTQAGDYLVNPVAGDGIVYFNGGLSGLRCTDGTVANTRSLAPFAALSGRTAGATLYFQSGSQLWRSDGTEAGTFEIRPADPALDWKYASPVAAVGGGMYVQAPRYATSSSWQIEATELWWTDGTPAGAVRAFTFPPEARIGGTTFGDTLVFSALDARKGVELWASSLVNGVPEPARMLKDIRTETAGSFPTEAVAVGAVRFFQACDTIRGCELWKTNGTPAGTALVKDIWPGPQGSYPQYLTAMDGRLYFTANDGTVGIELWASDGTEAGTVLVKNIFEGGSSVGSQPLYLTVVGSTLFFSALDQEGNTEADLWDPAKRHGRELWKSDGTPAGTVLVKDINVGSSPWDRPDSNPYALTAFAGRLFFSAHDPWSGGIELWTSDGTTAGTVLLKDLASGNSYPNDLVAMGGVLYFSAPGPSGGYPILWRSDGTKAGTIPVVENAGFSGVRGLVAGEGVLFFTAWDEGHGRELWATDGTAAGTRRVTDLSPGDFPESAGSSDAGYLDTRTLVAAGTRAYFTAYDPEVGWELWTSDGTSAGTRVVRDIWEGGDSYPFNLTPAAGLVVFSAYDPANGRELWTTDGTEAGTRLVAQIAPAALSSAPTSLAASGHLVFFAADDGQAGREPWMLDVTSPEQRIDGLIGRIEGLIDDGTLKLGQGKSLVGKLELALYMLEYGNTKKAITMLEAFIQEVEAFERARILSGPLAAELIGAAQDAINSLAP